jgi:CheY-like chemotaxis protein
MSTEATMFLLVEDDRNDVFLVEREFCVAPVNIHLAVVANGAEAVRYLEGQGEYKDRSHFPLPEVILLDLKMPKLNGFEFLQWLRTRAPECSRHIPVVVMSSSGDKADVSRAYFLGANSYMVKPIDWKSFRERINVLGVYWANHVEKAGLPCSAPFRREA